MKLMQELIGHQAVSKVLFCYDYGLLPHLRKDGEL